MFVVPLTAVPNQSIAFNVGGAYWQVKIYQAISHMCADVTRDGVYVIRGVRCFGGMPLMPYAHMYAPAFGNFVFDSEVDWEKFGTQCTLMYLDAVEFADYDAIYKRGGL